MDFGSLCSGCLMQQEIFRLEAVTAVSSFLSLGSAICLLDLLMCFFVEDSWYNGADGASVQATIAEITRIMKV